jgi:hypothetical protein
MLNSIEILENICSVRPDSFEARAFILTFSFGDATTTIRIVFDDEQSKADMVITNMTTLPDTKKNKGYGSNALKQLLLTVLSKGVNTVQAVQVQVTSERFWIRNNFQKLGNVTNDFVYAPTGDVS